jgi:hypothetical protein
VSDLVGYDADGSHVVAVPLTELRVPSPASPVSDNHAVDGRLLRTEEGPLVGPYGPATAPSGGGVLAGDDDRDVQLLCAQVSVAVLVIGLEVDVAVGRPHGVAREQAVRCTGVPRRVGVVAVQGEPADHAVVGGAVALGRGGDVQLAVGDLPIVVPNPDYS